MSSSGLTWFRLYPEIINDDKIRLLAFEDRWHFVAICCLKASGVLDEPDPELRRQRVRVNIGLAETDLEKMLDRLAKVRLIDRKTLVPTAWDDRQFQSDSSAERTRRWRQKQAKQARSDVVKRHGDVTVTCQETETETDKDKRRRVRAEPKNDAAAPLRGSRLTIGPPPDDWLAYCQAKRKDLDPQECWERFRDYWIAIPGRRGYKLDWAATWRNWVREARGARQRVNGGPTAKEVGRAQVMDAIFGKRKEVIDVDAAIVTARLG